MTKNRDSLVKSQAFLNELFEAVKIEEALLSGGENLCIGAHVVDSLRQTRINFGNPRNNLIRLTPELFTDIGLNLSSIHGQQMKDLFDFYYMTLSVNMQPASGVCFRRLKCQLAYGPEGKNEPIIQTLFPQGIWKEYLKFGYRMNLGLDENLSFKAGVNSVQLEKMAGLPMELAAKINSKNEIGAFAVIPEYLYTLGRTEITSGGEGDSSCFWHIETPNLKKGSKTEFAIVFKVPKAISKIELTGLVLAEPDMRWLTSNLRDVFEALNDKLKSFLLQKNHQRPLIGDHERWELDLPK